MIITRSPVRISLGGGGTDLPSYYRRHGGFVIAAAIDKYVCITLHETFLPEIIVKYSRLERVERVADIQQPIVREALRLRGIERGSLEITSMADIPAGTGLGSSGSFATALLKALHTLQKDPAEPRALAEEACTVELDRLGEPIGKQDQYIAAFGGLTCFEFLPDDRVEVRPLRVSPETIANLEDHLLLFFTGFSRSASGILKDQDDRSKADDATMLANLHDIKELGHRSKEALESGDLAEFARLMNVHWEHKKRRSGSMSNPDIDRWHAIALAEGAAGGKLIGAGGGGFLMFYADDPPRLRRSLAEAGLREIRFRFDFEGTKVVLQ